MTYALKNLAPGESILYRARYHWVFYSFSIIVLFLAAALGVASLIATKNQAGDEIGRPLGWLAAAFAAIALVAFLARRFRANLDEFVVTNRRVIIATGLTRFTIGAWPLEQIRNVELTQRLGDRLWGTGSIRFVLDGDAKVFQSVAESNSVLKTIEPAWRKRR